MTLADVQQAAETRRMAEADYRAAILASVKANGISRTATAAGVSRQAVAQLVKRALSEETAMRERLDTLDARWAALVAWRASAYTLKDASAITAGRNGQAKKRARRGLGPLRTVKAEALALAEAELLDLLEQNVGQDGLDFEVVRADLQEAELLRERLASPGDGIPF